MRNLARTELVFSFLNLNEIDILWTEWSCLNCAWSLACHLQPGIDQATKSGTHHELSWRWLRYVDSSKAATSTLNDGKFQPISFWMCPKRIILVSCQLGVSLVSFNETYLILVIRAVRRHVFCGRRQESGRERRTTKTSDDIKQLLLSSK